MKNKNSEIQVWHFFDPIEIYKIFLDNKLVFKINKEINLPDNIVKKVDEKWNAELSKNSKLKDNLTTYLESPLFKDEKTGIMHINVISRGYRYSHVYNRTQDFYDLFEDLKKYKLLSISTHCHIISKDNKILFGTKKNQFNQISGFSGFINVNEDSVIINEEKFLDVYKCIINRLKSEIGESVKLISSIKAIGMVYVNTVALRGIDLNFIVNIDDIAENIQKTFEESYQFEKKLYVVDFKPECLMSFFQEIHIQGKQMSKYALGCAYNVMNYYFGKDTSDKLLELIRKDIGISISTTNETNYFKD